MSKKKSKLKKTQVEQILDKNGIAYQQAHFPTKQDGDVQTMVVDHGDVDAVSYTHLPRLVALVPRLSW